MQRVDDGVAGDHDSIRRHRFPQERPARVRRRRKVNRGGQRRDPAVHLFRKRIAQIVASQAGLHVRHRNSRVERRHRGRQHGGGVPLHDHEIGSRLGQNVAHPGEHAGRQAGQILRPIHHIQIEIRNDAEQRQRLIEHLAVLRRADHERREPGSFLQCVDDWRQLDRFRAGSYDDGDRSMHATFLWRNDPPGAPRGNACATAGADREAENVRAFSARPDRCSIGVPQTARQFPIL